jgi:aspartate aminotransferase-like enzyme
MFIVDAVSSMTAVPLNFDALGIDVLLAGTQKAFRAATGADRVHLLARGAGQGGGREGSRLLFRFRRVPEERRAEHDAEHAEHPHVYALGSKLEEFFAEGLDARYARHRQTNQMTRDWAARHGFTLFPEAGFESITLTCVNNGAKPGGRTVDVAKLQKLVKEQGFLIDGGYGKIKGTTFRISNMGDETPDSMNVLFAALDKAMKQV